MGAINGTVTVTLSAPTTTLTTSDFTVSQAINSGTATSVTPTSVSVSGTTATLTVPTVSGTSSSQSVVDSVSLDGGAAVAASAFTVSASAVSSVTATNASNQSEALSGATDISANSPIAIKFSSPVVASSVTGSTVTLTQGGTLIATNAPTVSSDGLTVTLQPSAILANGKNYTLTINGVQFQNGGSLAKSYTASFTTSAAYVPTQVKVGGTVVSASNNNVVNVNSATNVVITYQQPLNVASVSSSDVTLKDLTANTTVPASSVTASGNAITFTVDSSYNSGDLNPNHQYEIDVNGVQAADGTTVAVSSNQFYYAKAFDVSNVVQADGSSLSGATVNGNLSAYTDANGNITPGFEALIEPKTPLDASTVNSSNIQLVNASNQQTVAANVSYNSANNLVTVVPQANLDPGTSFNLVIGTGVQDVYGQSLSSSQSTSFSTGNYTVPSVSSTSIQNGATGVSLNPTITLTFSTPMQTSAPLVNGSATSLTDFGISKSIIFWDNSANNGNGAAINATASWNSDNTVLTITPSSALTKSSSYTIEVAGNNSTSGTAIENNNSPAIPMASTYTLNFATGLGDTTAPTVSAVTDSGTAVTNGSTTIGNTDTFKIAFSKNMDEVPTLGAVSVTKVGGSSLSLLSTYTTSASSSTGSTTLTLSSVTGIHANDNLAIQLADGQSFNASVSSFSGSQITLSTALPSAVNNGATVDDLTNSALTFAPSSSGNYSEVTVNLGTVGAVNETKYTLSVGTGAVDSSSNMNALANQYNATFTTGPAPTFTVLPVGTTLTELTTTAGAVSGSTSLSGSFSSVFSGDEVAVQLAGGGYFFTTASSAGTSNTLALTDALPGNVANGAAVYDLKTKEGTIANFETGVDPTLPIAIQITGNSGAKVDTSTITSTTVTLTDSAGNVVPATVTSTAVGNDAYVSIAPTSPLNGNSTYTITVNGVKDLLGNVESSTSESFTTGNGAATTQLAVVSVTPSSTTNVALTATPIIEFNQTLDSSNVTVAPVNLSSATPSSGNQVGLYDVTTSTWVSGTYNLGTDGKSIVITPTNDLTAGDVYKIEVSSTVLPQGSSNTNEVANEMSQNYTYQFQTVTTAPTVFSNVYQTTSTQATLSGNVYSLASGDTIPYVEYSSNYLNASNLTTTVTNAVYGTSVSATSKLADVGSGHSNAVEVDITVPMSGTTYQVTISGLTDANGNPVDTKTVFVKLN